MYFVFMSKNKKLVWLIIILGLIGFSWWWQQKQLNNLWSQSDWSAGGRVMDWQKTSTDILHSLVAEADSSAAKVSALVHTPTPLRTETKNKTDQLTTVGVISQTNQFRQSNGLPLLVENSLLAQAAQKKLADMVAGQYFDHISPQGIGAGDLITSVGYKFIAVGENLAVGGYIDDADLVQAWMDSPGHRENILSTNYTEIGVAVQYVEFEGSMTWLAVQEFGRPTSDCPVVNQNLKNQITIWQQSLNEQAEQLDVKQAELTASKPDANATREKIQIYNQQVAEYNLLVAAYKQLADKLRLQVQLYNQQVEQFNLCLKK